jgi:phytoene synthase
MRLTELLRDRADAESNRLYLPRELLAAHDLLSNSPRSVLTHPALANVCASSPRWRKNITRRPQSDRRLRSPGARVAALILATYRAILQEIRARGWKHLESRFGFRPDTSDCA